MNPMSLEIQLAPWRVIAIDGTWYVINALGKRRKAVGPVGQPGSRNRINYRQRAEALADQRNAEYRERTGIAPDNNTQATVNVPSSTTPARSEDPVPYVVPGQPINPSAHTSKHEDAVIAEALEILERRVRRDAVSIGSPDDLRRYLAVRHAGLDREVFEVVYLTPQNKLIEVERLFTGTLTQTAVYPREVIKSALAHNAAGVILTHNHPSGVPDPSSADRTLTATLKTTLAHVDVTVLDHVITAGGQSMSFAERGLL